MPRRWRTALWSGRGALAATRVLLLAHYPSDVLAGWGIDALINKAVCRAFARAEQTASKNTASSATAPAREHFARLAPLLDEFDNDAVVQGLGEAPFMHDVGVWATFTIGTGLGNALYGNRKD